MAGQGTARRGMAGQGKARHGMFQLISGGKMNLIKLKDHDSSLSIYINPLHIQRIKSTGYLYTKVWMSTHTFPVQNVSETAEAVLKLLADL